MNRTLLEKARCMLSNTGLPIKFWAEAINTAYYLVNKFPSTTINCKTLEKIWLSSTTNYLILCVFGCPTYAHVNEGKLEPIAMKCIFLGYQDSVKGYKLWDPKESKLLISRDVTFDETTILNPRPHEDHDNKVQVHGVSKHVELEIEALKQKPKETHDEVIIT